MKTPDHENRAHSILGASSAKRWMMCPGSVALSELVPHDDTESFFAREGTAAHELCELALTEQLDPTMYVGKRIDGIPVTKEMALAVGMYCDKVNALTKSCGTEPQLEVRFSLGRLDPPVPMFGTGDCVVWAPLTDHLHVLDFKYGKGIVVEAEENPQLMYYALGAVLELKVKPKKITVWIIQPRAPHRDGVVRDYTFTWERLIEYRHELLAAAEATQQPDAELAVGDWCRYCPAHATCPAQERYALTVVQDAFAATTEPFLPEPETLGEDELNVILEHAELIESWFRSVRKHVFAQLERGEGHEGWKLVAKRATSASTRTICSRPPSSSPPRKRTSCYAGTAWRSRAACLRRTAAAVPLLPTPTQDRKSTSYSNQKENRRQTTTAPQCPCHAAVPDAGLRGRGPVLLVSARR